MRAVARLAWIFFTATPLTRWLAALGACAMVLGIAGYIAIPSYTLGSGSLRGPLWLQAVVQVLPALGLLSLLAATAPLPNIVERLALGRAVWQLPRGRLRLLSATLVPPLLLAALTAAVATIAIVSIEVAIVRNRLTGPGFALGPELGSDFVYLGIELYFRVFLMAFVDFGLVYAAIWLSGKTSGIWRLVGVFWILLSLLLPLRYLEDGIRPISALEVIGLACWVLFALSLLAGGRLRHAIAPSRARFRALRGRILPAARYRHGGEVALLLGTSRPWIIAFGQIIPIAAMLVLIPPLNPWMIVAMAFLVLMSAIAGAITSKAAERSRRLWLRLDWTRDEIRRHVELAFWRYNAWCIAVLVLAFIGVSAWLRLPPAIVATGAGLIVAAAVASTCLGLTITRGLGWLESAFCIVTITALVRATFATLLGEFRIAITFSFLLVALGLFYRWLANRRWHSLDWMRCRAT